MTLNFIQSVRNKVDGYPTSVASADDHWMRLILIRMIEVCFGQPKAQKLYEMIVAENNDKYQLWSRVLEVLNITIDMQGYPINELPKDCPVLIVANHPMGLVDGIGMGLVLSQLRENYKIILNSSLTVLSSTSVKDAVLPVDFSSDREAINTNIQTKRNAVQTLEAKGAVGIFPAGEVATAKYPLPKAPVYEATWKPFVARMARVKETLVLPIYFSGGNSLLFHLLSKVSMDIRVVLLCHETLRQRGKTFEMIIGEPFEINHSMKPTEVVPTMRDCVKNLNQQSRNGMCL